MRAFIFRRLKDSRGQAIVEMAMVLPILMVIATTILVGSILMMDHYSVTVAAREGARAYSLGDSPAEAEQRALQVLSDLHLNPNMATVQVYSCYSDEYACASITYSAPTLVPAFLFGGVQGNFIQLHSNAAFRKEGP